METTKVISVRLHKSTIEKLDKQAQTNRYWKRNAIISEILAKVLTYADDETLWQMLRYYPCANEKPRIEFVEHSPRL